MSEHPGCYVDVDGGGNWTEKPGWRKQNVGTRPTTHHICFGMSNYLLYKFLILILHRFVVNILTTSCKAQNVYCLTKQDKKQLGVSCHKTCV